jgi:hypothetical protein
VTTTPPDDTAAPDPRAEVIARASRTLPVAPLDPAGVVRLGRARRRRRRATLGGVLAAVLVVGGIAVGTGVRDERTDTAPAGRETTAPTPSETPATVTGGWTTLRPSPLSAREGTVTAAVAGEAVFVGGYAGPPCPPSADCVIPRAEVRRDGAAYDPVAGTWRSIADAPRAVDAYAARAVVDDDLYVLVDRMLLVWSSTADSWREVPLPPDAPAYGALVADGTRVVLASGSDENGEEADVVLDTTSGAWSTLPEDPLSPAFDRSVTATSAGLVLTAKPFGPDGELQDPSLVHAAVLAPDGSGWRELPASDQLGGWRWTWTGERLVDPTLGGADGGETNGYGRVIPYGGRLDVTTGTWTRLPDAPTERTGGWPVDAAAGPLAAVDGWLYDDRTGSWTSLPRPADAPPEPGSAVWVDDTLVVLGGADWDVTATSAPAAPEDVWSTGAWSYAVGS